MASGKEVCKKYPNTVCAIAIFAILFFAVGGGLLQAGGGTNPRPGKFEKFYNLTSQEHAEFDKKYRCERPKVVVGTGQFAKTAAAANCRIECLDSDGDAKACSFKTKPKKYYYCADVVEPQFYNTYTFESNCKRECEDECYEERKYYKEKNTPCFNDWCLGDHKCKYNYTSVIKDKSGTYCTQGQSTSKCEDDWFHCDCDDTHNSQCKKKDEGMITAGRVLMIIGGIALLILSIMWCDSNGYLRRGGTRNTNGFTQPIEYLRGIQVQ